MLDRFYTSLAAVMELPAGSLLSAAVLLLICGYALGFAMYARGRRTGIQQAIQAASTEAALLNERSVHQTREHERIELELRQQLANASASLRELDAQQRELLTTEAALRVRLEETERTMAARESLLATNTAALKSEFATLAREVFDAQSNRVAEIGEQRLDHAMAPFRTQLEDFKRRADEIHHLETRERASLLTEVRSLQQASERVNTEAANLTRALKGDTRLQGQWGEMVLERLLEHSGLERGREYETQWHSVNADGERKRPDVVVHLPDNKDIIIDAKASLVAYDRANRAVQDATRSAALRDHARSLRRHVLGLGEQNYHELPGLRSLDFVLLFVPIDQALTVALEEDSRLLEDAMQRQVLLVSPATLLLSLRVVHNLWRHDKQNRNAREIAERAGAIYDKVRLLVDDLDVLGKQLTAADKAYANARSRLHEGRGNLVRQVQQMEALGARVRTRISSEAVLAASDAD